MKKIPSIAIQENKFLFFSQKANFISKKIKLAVLIMKSWKQVSSK